MLIAGHPLRLPRHWTLRRWIYRSPLGGLIHSAVFGLGLFALALLLLFAADTVIGAIKYKAECPYYDAKRGWGHDEQNRPCRRRD